MRKAVVGGLAALAAVVAAILVAPAMWAQVRPAPPVVNVGPLWGPGGELGVSVRDLRGDEVARATLERAGGVVVEDVEDGSAAAKAGLKPGDIIVDFDGERVRSTRHFSRLVRETPEGRTVRATIVRGGARQTLDVTPERGDRITRAMPDVRREIERGMRALPRDFDFDFQLPRPDVFNPRGRLGVSLAPLTDQLASYFGVKQGVLVSSVEPESPAAQAGLKAGDVITAVAGRSVSDPGDVSARIREATPGSPVEIRIVRDRKEMTMKATLPERRQLTRERVTV
jgi:S1-C subfamily serine protease